MLFDHYSSALQRFRSYLAVVVSPIQYTVNTPINFVSWLIDDMSSQQSLIILNNNLQAEITFLKAQLQKQMAIERENKELRQLLLSTNTSAEKMAEAQLIAVAPDPFVHQVVINKGTHAGLFVGQPVIDAYGVMGQVIQVGVLTSRVLLLTDSTSEIPVQIERNGVRAIAQGDPSTGQLSLKDVTETTDVQVGDKLITSGLGGHYPFGYPVGEIIQVGHNADNQFSSILAKPTAHINRSRLVLLIWPNSIKVSPKIKKALTKPSTNQLITQTGGAS